MFIYDYIMQEYMDNKLLLLNKIRDMYEKNDVNIIQWLKNKSGSEMNDLADILISYDFQAGTYSKRQNNFRIAH